MRTAKEVLDANFSNVFDHSQKVLIRGFMKEYAIEACKEQRDICVRQYILQKGNGVEGNINAIENAPNPFKVTSSGTTNG